MSAHTQTPSSAPPPPFLEVVGPPSRSCHTLSRRSGKMSGYQRHSNVDRMSHNHPSSGESEDSGASSDAPFEPRSGPDEASHEDITLRQVLIAPSEDVPYAPESPSSLRLEIHQSLNQEETPRAPTNSYPQSGVIYPSPAAYYPTYGGITRHPQVQHGARRGVQTRLRPTHYRPQTQVYPSGNIISAEPSMTSGSLTAQAARSFAPSPCSSPSSGYGSSQRASSSQPNVSQSSGVSLSPFPDAGPYLRNELRLPEDAEVNLQALADPAPGDKPPQAYPLLIKLAIYGSPEKRLTLQEIYEALENRFEWYREHTNEKSWKNSIRHNLSLNKVFRNIPRASHEPGKGSYWCLNTSQGEGYKRERKRRPRRGRTIFDDVSSEGGDDNMGVSAAFDPRFQGHQVGEERRPPSSRRRAHQYSLSLPQPMDDLPIFSPETSYAHSNFPSTPSSESVSSASPASAGHSSTELGTQYPLITEPTVIHGDHQPRFGEPAFGQPFFGQSPLGPQYFGQSAFGQPAFGRPSLRQGNIRVTSRADLPEAFMPTGQYLRMGTAGSSYDIPTSMLSRDMRAEHRPGSEPVHSGHDPNGGVSAQRTGTSESSLSSNPNPGGVMWYPDNTTTEEGLGWPTREQYTSRGGRGARDAHDRGNGGE